MQPLPAPEAHDEELCFLSGQWRIWQKLERHRYSTDDVVTAWVAWRARAALAGGAPAVLRAADIGCGIGSVLLFTAWLHPHAVCVGIEAQAERASMAARSAVLNAGPPSCGRVAVVQGDLRDPAALAAAGAAAQALVTAQAQSEAESGDNASHPAAPQLSDGSDGSTAAFDLVTGTPPYFDLDIGGLPSSEESARCLFRYRGGMEAYCLSASRMLATPPCAPRWGLFVVCDTAMELARSYAAASAAGLRIIARVDLVPKEGKPPLFNVFVMCAREAPYDRPPAEGGGVPFPPHAFSPRGTSPYGEPPGTWGAPVAADPRTAADPHPAVDPHSAVDPHLAVDGAGVPPPPLPAARQLRKQRHKPYPGAQDGELVVSITVRGADDLRTPEYVALLHDLGKKG